MKIGDCYILSSDFINKDIGMVLIGENKKEYFFTPIILTNDRFSNNEGELFDGSILTREIFHGLKGDTVTGILVIHEYKNQPSFLTKYCQDNRPFINLSIDNDKLVLGEYTADLTKITIGIGTTMPATKSMFDKFHIQSLLHIGDNILTDLNTILKSK